MHLPGEDLKAEDQTGSNALAVAIHEAGHAAIAHFLQRGCNGIDFYAVKEGSERYAGQMWPHYNDSFPLLPEEQWDATRLESEILVLMGGEIAQQEFGLTVEDIAVSDDRERVDRLVHRLVKLDQKLQGYPSEKQYAERKMLLQARACEIIRQNLTRIQALADALLDGKPRSFLDGEEIAALLD